MHERVNNRLTSGTRRQPLRTCKQRRRSKTRSSIFFSWVVAAKTLIVWPNLQAIKEEKCDIHTKSLLRIIMGACNDFRYLCQNSFRLECRRSWFRKAGGGCKNICWTELFSLWRNSLLRMGYIRMRTHHAHSVRLQTSAYPCAYLLVSRRQQTVWTNVAIAAALVRFRHSVRTCDLRCSLSPTDRAYTCLGRTYTAPRFCWDLNCRTLVGRPPLVLVACLGSSTVKERDRSVKWSVWHLQAASVYFGNSNCPRVWLYLN